MVRISAFNSNPDGVGVHRYSMPSTCFVPLPVIIQTTGADRGLAKKLEEGRLLSVELEHALTVIRTESRSPLLDVRMAVPDQQ